ncbi:N-acetyl-gamma-glutamyl-phosphate reductase [Oscillibacter valericigenes]|uniref:N-acetyl-gamma-glutamyl-phosphate reductase n=1 Tax=Oscillibacter valericigenes TaxID=351091 RepID=UPI001F31AEFD|nr:N-acetyl-gamma-glutamyl-phosphate reductase [Oscillibacter valericigenes]MCF2617243.1 N-acetyl-gamma-glutamyl-phosphate reductase [Oscillibacter valericigenes]
MKPKVYIDGKDGTTGLQIYDRLSVRSDIDLLLIDEEKRKDPAERKKLMDAADIVFLCLPDAAAVEAVALVENPDTRIIDASTAHRTSPDWDYGFPELSAERRAAIRKSKRVANPGCHATGFISAVYPLVAMGLLPKDACLSAFSLTGYSGGGKKMIAQYEAADKDAALFAPCPYGMGQTHKHLPEMQKVCGLTNKPVFTPIVDDYYKGMATTVPLHMSQMNGVSTLAEVRQKLADYYAGATLVHVADALDTAKLYANAQAGKDTLVLYVAGNDEQFTVTALFDNLGKGASGAAVQNMNLMLGFEETTGLNLK